MNTPRGIRNNNPGNIRRSPTIWQGESQGAGDPDFVTFTDPVYGIRAIARILLTYDRDGLQTVSEIINRWAPRTENATDAYVQAVSTAVGTDEYAALNVPAMLPQLIKAIIEHENGEQPYTDEQIAKGIELATGIET
jgi:hypothetical protein